MMKYKPIIDIETIMKSDISQLNKYDWKEFNSAKRWVKRLTLRSDDKEVPEGTLVGMQTWFPQFLKFHKKNPDELIEEALTDLDIPQERLDDFYRFKKKQIDRNSCITGIYGIIRGFYRHNRINTQDIIAPKFSVRMVKKTDRNFPLFKIVTVSEKKRIVLNRKLLREFYSKLNTRDQCLLLCFMSTGLDSSDFLKLTVGDIRIQMDKLRIHLNGNRNKTSEEFSDFCSIEASELIKSYVKKQRVDATDDEPVFVVTRAGQKARFFQQNGRSWKIGDTLETPNAISPREIADAFRTAQRNMGIPLQKGKQGPLRPKRFKKVFRTACSNAGLDKDITKLFLGHKGDQSQNYQEDDREVLEYYFEMVEPKISLFFNEEEDIIDKNQMKLELFTTQKLLSDVQLEVQKLRDLSSEKESVKNDNIYEDISNEDLQIILTFVKNLKANK